MKFQHHIRKQTIEIEVASEALALALQPRLQDFNRKYFLPAMERIFDEFSVPDTHIKISSLVLDLGNVPINRLEELAVERFNFELRRALDEALRRQQQDPAPDNYSQTESASRLELFEYYLRNGTLPFWASGSSVFSFEELVSELIEGEEASLVQLIKQHAYQRNILERIVLQLGEATLQRLLRALEPKHAALIITCLTDLQLTHRVAPVVELSEKEFARSLWLLTLTYVLQEPGSQFNRKTLVEWLLKGIARDEGLDYQQLMLELDRGLKQAMKRWPFESSLPAIISGITHELNLDLTVGQPQADSPLKLLEHYLRYGTVSSPETELNFGELLIALAANDPAGLVRVVREHAHGRVLERLVIRLGEQPLKRLLHVLEPANGSLIIALLTDLRASHRVEPLVNVGANEFSKSLWILTLTYVTQARGSQFNRKNFVRSLFEELAESEDTDYSEILVMVHFGLQQGAGNRPHESSLLAITGELISELEDGALVSLSTDDDKSTHQSDALVQLELYLGVSGERDVAAARLLLQQLAHRDKSGLSSLVDRLVLLFSPTDLLAVLAPEQKQFLFDFAGVLRDATAQVAEFGSSVDRDDVVWKAALEFLLADSSARWNRRAMVRQMVAVVAERVGTPSISLADSLAEALQQTVGPSVIQAVNAIRMELRDRTSWEGEVPPAFARYDHVEVIRYYLRFGVLPWNALLHDSQLTVESVLAFLPGLPRSLLYAVFAQESPGGQRQAIRRAIRMIPEESFLRLLRTLLTQVNEPASPFRSTLMATAARVENKQEFYARLLSATLKGRPLNLEELAGSVVSEPITIEPVLANDPAEWPVNVIKSALASRLRFGETDAGEHTRLTLLDTLIARHPEDARHFCRALRDSPDLLAALTDQFVHADFERLLALLRPGDLAELQMMTRDIADLPAAYSQPAAKVHKVLLAEVLRFEADQPLPDSFFENVLRKLFEPLPDKVHELLLVHQQASGSVAITPTIRKSSASLEQVFAFLLRATKANETDSTRLQVLPSDTVIQTLASMLEESTEEICRFVTRHVKDSRVLDHWVKTLPESTLARLSYLLEPRKHRSLLNTAEVLASAWLEAAPSGFRVTGERQEFWRFLLKFLDQNADAGCSIERLVEAFFKDVATRYVAACAPSSPAVADLVDVGTRMLKCATRLAGPAGHVKLHVVLRSKREVLLAPWVPSRPKSVSTADLMVQDHHRSSADTSTTSKPRRMAFSLEVDKENNSEGQPVYINNAGLVLTGPFLPHLFETLDLLHLDDEGRTSLRSREALSRAVHLLQYLVDGCTSAPEPLLVLNKILCGVPVSAPVDRDIEPAETERATCDHLLRAMIANWTTISNTSIAGLQETFFRREGKLERRDEGWKLRIQRKTVDVLVDQVPWTISVIFNRWMAQPLYVDW